MNTKKLHLILEYLAKCKNSSPQTQEVYVFILNQLANEGLCSKSMFTCKQISKLLQKEVNDYEKAKALLEKTFKEFRHKDLQIQKEEIYTSLMSGNFPTHKAMLSKGIEDFEASLSNVEAKMYMMIKTYIQTLCEALEFFMIFDEQKKSNIESVTSYALKVHDSILQNLFYEEEKVHIDESLKQLAIVYIGLYYRSFYG